MLAKAHADGRLTFLGTHAGLSDRGSFKRFLAPLRTIDWVVDSRAPFAGPEQVLRYLSRYTHRVAISNRRLVAADDDGVSFRWKDYRVDGPGRWKTMMLKPFEFIRRFLMHVLPKGFHRIRHYGLFAGTKRAANLAKARALLGVTAPTSKDKDTDTTDLDMPHRHWSPCPCCGSAMLIIEVFGRDETPRHQPSPKSHLEGYDTS
jgi:hypothetical protein